MKVILCIMFSLINVLFSQQEQNLFDEGNTFYSDGEYDKAIEKYEALLETGVHSSEVYFNLGNSHYKLNSIASSIYYYEKALMLSPNDKEIQNNLAFAQNMTIDAIEAIPELGISKFFEKLINLFNADAWAILSVVFLLFFVIFFITYYFTSSTGKKRFTFVASSAAVLLTLICFSFAFQKQALDKKDNPAIIFAQATRVKTDPNQFSEELFRLHEGTKVQIIDTINNWSEVLLADGKTGWIISKDIKALKKF